MQLNKWCSFTLVVLLLDVPGFNTGVQAQFDIWGGVQGLIGAATSFFGRRKRTFPEESSDGQTDITPDFLFAAADNLDKEFKCARRLICEVAATPEEELAEDEAEIMAVFKPDLELGHEQTYSHETPFLFAAYIGRQAGSVEVCAKEYPKCPQNKDEIMEKVRKIKQES